MSDLFNKALSKLFEEDTLIVTLPGRDNAHESTVRRTLNMVCRATKKKSLLSNKITVATVDLNNDVVKSTDGNVQYFVHR